MEEERDLREEQNEETEETEVKTEETDPLEEQIEKQKEEAEDVVTIEEENEEPEEDIKPHKGKGKKILAIILIIAFSAVFGFGGGMLALYYGNNLLPGKQAQNITINPQDNINTAEAVATKVIPSVVGISTKQEVNYQSFFGVQKGVAEGVGTGIIVDDKGYILTNSHVVNDGSVDQIKVSLYDGSEVAGKVLWSDKTLDMAIVKIDAKSKLVAAELGDSDTVKIGSYAVAIGNPLGLTFEGSVTQGIISGLNRTINISDGQNVTTMEGLIQTDASINPGNSGGPLLNSQGQVIGINSAKAQSSEGLGFAIPINTAKPIIDEIKTKGEFTRAYIGIRGVSVADYLSANPEAKLGTDKGVLIMQIYTDSPASKTGIQEQDIITGIDSKDVGTMSELTKVLYGYRPGDTVELKLVRDGKAMSLQVTLSELKS